MVAGRGSCAAGRARVGPAVAATRPGTHLPAPLRISRRTPSVRRSPGATAGTGFAGDALANFRLSVGDEPTRQATAATGARRLHRSGTRGSSRPGVAGGRGFAAAANQRRLTVEYRGPTRCR